MIHSGLNSLHPDLSKAPSGIEGFIPPGTFLHPLPRHRYVGLVVYCEPCTIAAVCPDGDTAVKVFHAVLEKAYPRGASVFWSTRVPQTRFAPVDKEWEKLENCRHGRLPESGAKKELIKEGEELRRKEDAHEDWSISSRFNCRINFLGRHIKIQLTRRSNTKDNDYEIKNHFCRRK